MLQLAFENGLIVFSRVSALLMSSSTLADFIEAVVVVIGKGSLPRFELSTQAFYVLFSRIFGPEKRLVLLKRVDFE